MGRGIVHGKLACPLVGSYWPVKYSKAILRCHEYFSLFISDRNLIKGSSDLSPFLKNYYVLMY